MQIIPQSACSRYGLAIGVRYVGWHVCACAKIKLFDDMKGLHEISGNET